MKGEKKVKKWLAEKAAEVEKEAKTEAKEVEAEVKGIWGRIRERFFPEEKGLTAGQVKTLRYHKPAWWMKVVIWFQVKKIVYLQRLERVRSWLLIPGWAPGISDVRKGIRKALRKGNPIPVYRDMAIVEHVKSLSRKDLERLAIVQATHLRTYLDFYGKNLVNHIAIDGQQMTSAGLKAQKAKGVKGPEDLKK